MEKKNLKKLELNKKVIAKLSDNTMVNIKGGTTLACLYQIGDAMQANSDGPYFMECMGDGYYGVGGSYEIVYGGCLITD